MPRTMSSVFAAELDKAVLRPAFFWEAMIGGSYLRLWTGSNDVFFPANNQIFLGNGWLEGFSSLSDDVGLVSSGVTFALTGIPVELTALILGSARKYEKCDLWLAFLNENNYPIAYDLEFTGELETAVIERSESGASASIVYENILLDLQRKKERRWSDAIQQERFPGDRGFEYLPQVVQWSGFWGKPEANRGAERREDT